MKSGLRTREPSLKTVVEPLQFPDGLEDPTAAAIMRAVSDEPSRTILTSIISSGKSIEEITTENGVPVSTTYRRVHELCKKGLIIVERVKVTKNGKRRSIYRSVFRGARIDVENGRVQVVGLPNDGIPDITFRHWQSAESLGD